MPTLNRDPTETMATEHAAGCTYGGFSCGYWLIGDGCTEQHWEKHYVQGDGRCPCGTEYPGAANTVVFFDATSARKETMADRHPTTADVWEWLEKGEGREKPEPIQRAARERLEELDRELHDLDAHGPEGQSE